MNNQRFYNEELKHGVNNFICVPHELWKKCRQPDDLAVWVAVSSTAPHVTTPKANFTPIPHIVFDLMTCSTECAVWLVVERKTHKELRQNITLTLQQWAKEIKSSPTKVEKAIKHLTELGLMNSQYYKKTNQWTLGNPELWETNLAHVKKMLELGNGDLVKATLALREMNRK